MQDAHEFILKLIEQLQVDLDKCKKDIEEDPIKSPFEMNFGYQFEEVKSCHRCGFKSTKSKNDLILRLDMPDQNSHKKSVFTLEYLLKKTMEGGGVTINCEKCSSGVDKKANNHSCRDYFQKLPRVLILYLPRTAWLQEMRDAQKNRVRIQVPKVLDLKSHCAKDCNHEEIQVPEAIRKRPYRKRKSSFSLLDDMDDDDDDEDLFHKLIIVFVSSKKDG